MLGLTAFQKTLTPYLTFDEARKSRGAVQVMGALDKQSDRYDTGKQELSFDARSTPTGGRMPVVYRGIKPGNFKDAISIVAIGRYRDGRIEAEKLLVKCPSKYQGAEVEKAYSAAPDRARPDPDELLLARAWPRSGARSSRVSPPSFCICRVDRGRRDLLPLARSAYAAFATCIVAASASAR